MQEEFLSHQEAAERRFAKHAAELDARISDVRCDIDKDSPIALIMSALMLKDDQGNTDTTPEFAWFQPSLDQVVMPIYSESSSVDREMLLSDAIPAIHQSAKRRGLCPPSSSAP
ncbi:hypothetical protein Tco_1305166, partial [Tanacetum coccineum]